MKSKVLNTFLGLALLILLVLLVSSMIAGCSMTFDKPTIYKGKAEATKPYVEMGEMFTTINGCDRGFNTCEAVMSLTPHIHNPTKYNLNGQVVCKFSVRTGSSWDTYSIQQKSKLIRLGPKGSKTASVRIFVRGSVGVPANQSSDVSSSCWLRYRKVFK